MPATRLQAFKDARSICLIQTEDDAKEEETRAGVRKAQRERRKERMKLQKTQRQQFPVPR